jgi:CheY-like chemotaxis protein
MTGKEKILVLDDEQKWLDVVKDILSPQYDLTLTTSYKEAIRKVTTHPFVLAVVDIKLPDGMNGFDVLVKMRKRVPNLRAIMLTGYNESDFVMASIRAGALDYIKKTSELEERLLSSIKEHKRTEVVKAFLSYDRSDFKPVSNLHRKLTVHGFVPWLDRYDIGLGRWKPQIKKEIWKTNFFLVCLTNNSVINRGFIKEEIEWALKRQEELGDETPFIIPVRLGKCEIPRLLRDFQAVDLVDRNGFDDLVRKLMPKK